MLTSIEQINNLGVFDHYKKGAGLAEFERFNILYGMNGSGKTTLSLLFSYLNEGVAEAFPSLKYKVQAQEGKFIEGQSYPLKIRVFNSEYVDSNIGEIEGQLNPIFIVGEENKALVAQLQKDEESLTTLEKEKTGKEQEKEKLEKNRGKKFTEVAKLITSDASGQVTRTYRKPDAEKAFAKLEEETILEENEISRHRTTLRQTSLESLTEFKLGQVKISKGDKSEQLALLDAVTNLEEKTKTICPETSNSVAIQRLRDNADVATWVEQGLELHKKHKSTKCEYCLQPIPNERLAVLGKHFNQSDRILKMQIEGIIKEVCSAKKILEQANFPPKMQLYDELRTDYQASVGGYKTSKNLLEKNLGNIHDLLNEKLTKRTEKLAYNVKEFETKTFEDAVAALNEHIEAHNKKTAEFEEHAEEARKAIEDHHLSTIKPEIDELDIQISEIDDRLTVIEKGDHETEEVGTTALNERIVETRQKVSNTAKAAANLTERLQTFLGRGDLKFEPEGEGYRIMRGNEAAKSLSEGEKTAITFIYFIVQLGDQDFDLKKGIIVIDDPVSSLDSNSVYQAFSFLKNAVKDAKQIFMFTHNFDFLKLLLNWCKNIPKPKVNGKSSYYMLLCNIEKNNDRKATLTPLDKELLQNESEYSYLFKQLYKFKSDGTIAGSYHIPNIARKVLEAFLGFYYPGAENLYRKLERVGFDEHKKTAIYKFANVSSHATGKGFDPALVSESQNNVTYLLEMIKKVSPTHYASLKDSIDPT